MKRVREMDVQPTTGDSRRRRGQEIPVSLGKASLRIRLEAYYSLIAPDNIANRTDWLQKYDQIYEKYGGSQQGERKLATKLAKKYGTAVRLLLAESGAETPKNTVAPSITRGTGPDTTSGEHECHDEEWYQLRPNEAGSDDVNFLSDNFDPISALTGSRDSEELVYQSNPWMMNVPPPDDDDDNDGDDGGGGGHDAAASSQFAPLILDNVEKFAIYLPPGDPLRRVAPNLRKRANADGSVAAAAAAAVELKKRPASSHPFESIAQEFDTAGPHSVLYKLQHRRVRIVVGYVNAIRGTLTGTLLAFDKHMNMILQDVEEVYSPRPVDEHNDKSNVDLELERRRGLGAPGSLQDLGECIDDDADTGSASRGWTVKTRLMRQLLVRGDMVVSVYEASKVRNLSKSQYFSRAVRKVGETTKATVDVPNEQRKR